MTLYLTAPFQMAYCGRKLRCGHSLPPAGNPPFCFASGFLREAQWWRARHCWDGIVVLAACWLKRERSLISVCWLCATNFDKRWLDDLGSKSIHILVQFWSARQKKRRRKEVETEEEKPNDVVKDLGRNVLLSKCLWETCSSSYIFCILRFACLLHSFWW